VSLVRRHPILTGLTILVLAVLTLFGAISVAVWRAAHTDDARRVGHVDLIAILGAAQYNGRPSPVFQGRLQQGALLFREGFAPRVLVLGGKQPGDATTEGDAGRQWLISRGLPVDDVFSAPVGNDTLQSLQAAAMFMHRLGLRTVFLVSDPWHNLRIRKIARDLGVQAFVSATWHSAARRTWTRLAGYSRETFAYLYYRIFHR